MNRGYFLLFAADILPMHNIVCHGELCLIKPGFSQYLE